MRIKIWPYKQGSGSAKTLANALNAKVLKHVGSKYNPREGDVVINWGSSAVPNFWPALVFNSDVTKAQNKLTAFQTLKEAGVSVPEFWTSSDDIPDSAYPIVCRTVLTGHSGAGIVIATNASELVAAPLYVAYKKKKDEYRVHVMDGKAFYTQRKARKLDCDTPNWMVRNLAGGFVFVECCNVPECVIQQAEQSIMALGLDFGGVDVIYNSYEGKAYVLEINTACGLEDRTAEKYRNAFALAFTDDASDP